MRKQCVPGVLFLRPSPRTPGYEASEQLSPLAYELSSDLASSGESISEAGSVTKMRAVSESPVLSLRSTNQEGNNSKSPISMSSISRYTAQSLLDNQTLRKKALALVNQIVAALAR